MFSKISSILIATLLVFFFNACEKEILTNDTSYGDDNTTTADLTALSSNLSAIILNIGSSQTIEITATKADGTDDSFDIISSSSIFDATISYSNIVVTTKSAGLDTLIIKSASGKNLSIPVTIIADDVPTLDLNETSLTMDINTTYSITATATTDGVIVDTIDSVAPVNPAIATATFSSNEINITAVSAGTTYIAVTSTSGLLELCEVIVSSVYADGEDVNNLVNDTNTTAFAITIDTNISGSVENINDWYEFNVTSYTDYNLTLKKITGVDTLSVNLYADLNTDPVALSVANINSSTSYIFTPSQNTTYFLQVTADALADSISYELNISNMGIDYNLTTDGANFTTREIKDNTGNIHSFSGVYGELYEVWVLDSDNNGDPYTVDVNISLYTADMNEIYVSNSDKSSTEAELVNPIRDEILYIKVIPKVAGQTGTYAIKVVSTTSYSDGMKTVLFPLSNFVAHSAKVGINSTDTMSYYSTDATLLLEKEVVIDSVSSSINFMKVNFYEDENCTTVVESFDANITVIKHTYTKSGTFCLGIENNNTANTTFNLTINPNKTEATKSYIVSNLNLTIPDNNVNGISSTTEISYGLRIITKVTVDVNISHGYDGDLIISLTPPDNTEIVLSDANGGDGNDYNNTRFDNDANISISVGTAPFTGSYIPDNTLSDLNNTSADGNWTLKVSDVYSGTVGTLNGWSLTIE